MTYQERDTMTAEEAQTSRKFTGKSRMQIDEITAEIQKRKEQQRNEKN